MIGRLAVGALLGAAGGGLLGTIPGVLAQNNVGIDLGPMGAWGYSLDPVSGNVVYTGRGPGGFSELT